MGNKLINKEISELKNLIKTNSKDAQYADILVDSLVRKAKAEAFINLLGRDMGKVEETLDMGAYCLIKTTNGIIYKTYGGYFIYATKDNACLHSALMDLMQYVKDKDKYEKDEKDSAELLVFDINNILRLPMYIFADMKFFVDVANVVDKYLLDLHEKSSEKLQEETPDLDKAFENAVMALENIENGSEKEENKGDEQGE